MSKVKNWLKQAQSFIKKKKFIEAKNKLSFVLMMNGKPF